MTKVTIIQAVFSLGGYDSVLRVVGNTYEGIEWIGKPKFTKKQIENEVERLQREQDSKEYQRLRAAEYPDFHEYLDGIVKGDSEQIQAYIDACLAVKEKYPKN